MLPRLFFIVSIISSLSAHAYELRTDSQGDVVRWLRPVEFVVDATLATHLGESLTDAAVRAAVKTVDDATPDLSVTVRVGTTRGLGYVIGASNNQNDIFVLDEWPYDESALAATIVTLKTDTNEILDADIVFNGANHKFRVVDAMPSGLKNSRIDDVQNTLTHELGHALGLMHNADDEKVVMYPSAAPLEISKRVLAQDDIAGLTFLYSSVPGAEAAIGSEPIVGCSSTGSATSGMALGFAAIMSLLRRRSARAGLLVASVQALTVGAAEPTAAELSLEEAPQVALAEVVSTTTTRVPGRPGLLVTEITLVTRTCVKGVCQPQQVLRVPGGRLGTIEQVVAHAPVPHAQETVMVVHQADHRGPRVVPLLDEEHRSIARWAIIKARLAVPSALRESSPRGR